MAQKKPTFTEQFQKAIRGFKRNLKLLFADATPQLRYATQSVMLKGPDADIRKLRGLDLEIGALMQPYKDAGRVPEKVTAEIDRHVKDVSESFSRVAAVAVSDVTTVDTGLARITTYREQAAVRDIEYASTYTSPSGGKIEQRLLKTRLG